ncbi:iron-containing alcohol dehydrogenase [Ensifer adhaerens]|uniref:iron-containing alcohol dehydrogenase n=1 Tax=Ensifer adhaerens TaxID=106592 RepID=UPI001CBEA0FB|nr:iron-containing alcohol dehydrogenase [Ensifer adhaerens]MBZ7921489.1 iron-containing alcohol dehydrogenase [Ensifer adhaerens]UAX93915.1 iron-containing alcohol dehydrogenase [Ensifer adhaerens]UAY01550.1 iron-containing alcohol dehydrogenase [Ensifer adhaerens]UAY08933.1 iron-containing alcohol dehydrogenase [Ensifer adhaerens]
MSELRFLPQESVIWGHGVLQDTVTRLADYEIYRPIAFTSPSTNALYERFIGPGLSQAAAPVSDLPPHVPDVAVQNALEAVLQADAQSIIALGGGSVLDAAKAVSHLHHRRTGRFLPIAAFPTTLSGSEFSHYFGVTETDGSRKFKRSYAVRETTPRLVVIDPLLVESTPRSILLSSAIKAIDHAVEGMRKVECDHPHAILAATGAQRFFSVLERWPSGMETREAIASGRITRNDLLQLQIAAWQCYFYPASISYGLSHRIGHILGGTFGLPHSVTSCITLAPVIRACSDFYGEKLGIFTSVGEGLVSALALADRIEGIVGMLGLPSAIGSFDLPVQALPTVAALLEEHYPHEVSDLGARAPEKLITLLRSIW